MSKDVLEEDKNMPVISQEQMMDLLGKCYDMALQGVPGSKNCEDLAKDYLEKYVNPRVAAKKLVANQVMKCSTSGFVSGFGGLITLPVTIPANIASVIYVQMRMVAAIAFMGGYDVHSDQVQTLVYLCLVGTTITDIVKSTGVQVANKITMNMLKKLPGTVLTKINQKVGFKLITKFGTKGAINLVKMVPVAGAVVGAGMDFAGTKVIAQKAYDAFLKNEIV